MNIRDGEIDDLDQNGFWRLFDALRTAAFRGESDVGRVVADAGGERLGSVRAKIFRNDW
jgi:hypothetical protein